MKKQLFLIIALSLATPNISLPTAQWHPDTKKARTAALVAGSLAIAGGSYYLYYKYRHTAPYNKRTPASVETYSTYASNNPENQNSAKPQKQVPVSTVRSHASYQHLSIRSPAQENQVANTAPSPAALSTPDAPKIVTIVPATAPLLPAALVATKGKREHELNAELNAYTKKSTFDNRQHIFDGHSLLLTRWFLNTRDRHATRHELTDARNIEDGYNILYKQLFPIAPLNYNMLYCIGANDVPTTHVEQVKGFMKSDAESIGQELNKILKKHQS